jgi:hypothetical protein
MMTAFLIAILMDMNTNWRQFDGDILSVIIEDKSVVQGEWVRVRVTGR